MKRVISASRRTDLVAQFPEWLTSALAARRAVVHGPSGRESAVDLDPAGVHTIVLWSKDFSHLIENRLRLRDLLGDYAQLYLHFTITGLGGTALERGAPVPDAALRQLEPLLEIVGSPGRLSPRFDPVLHWRSGGAVVESNLPFFERLADRAGALGLIDIRLSFAQWYGKARRRAVRQGLECVDPPQTAKIEEACRLAETAARRGLRLFACSQNFLTVIPGIEPSACIDGRLLSSLHPNLERASTAEDRTQRAECRCTASVDIGSYEQTCPHGCVYCYANPRV